VKYLASLLAGMVVGAAGFAFVLYVNPFMARDQLSPIAVSSANVISLSYSAAIDDSIIYTNSGEKRLQPHPAKVLQLWEAPVRHTTAAAMLLRDGRGEIAGLGIKFSSDSEATRLLNGQAIVDSAWHIYLPGRGTMFIDQSENYWGYLREIVLPAYWSSADNWRGNWHGNLTSGPGALGTARVTGGSGKFAGVVTDGVESVTAKAYSIDRGPVAVEARLTIELPDSSETVSADLQD